MPKIAYLERVALAYITNDRDNRQRGRTTALAEATKKIDGILVTATEQMKKYYTKVFDCTTISIGELLRLYGQNKPIIFDHYALTVLFKDFLGYRDEDNPLYKILNNIYGRMSNIEKSLEEFKKKKRRFFKRKKS